MKKLIAAFILGASLISFSSHAQTAHRQHPDMTNMKQMLKDSLQLTDVQADSVISIHQQNMGTMMSIRNDNSLSDEQRKQQIKDAREQMKTRLQSILSKDQIEKLQNMQRERRGEHGGYNGKRMKMNDNQNSTDSTK